MATVTLYNRINQVGSSNVVEDKRVFSHPTGGGGDTVQLPLNTPVGYWFILHNSAAGADVLTAAAQSGESVSGDTSLNQNGSAIYLKTGATTWKGIAVAG